MSRPRVKRAPSPTADPPRQATIIDVAGRAGLSKSVVSRVMRGEASVSPASRAAVIAAAEELGYRANAAARSLVQRRSYNVGVMVSDLLKQYVIALVNATRSHDSLRLGASPRATLHLLRASRAWAALDGRDYVIPDDVQALAVPVLAHRLLPTPEALVAGQLPEQVLAGIVAKLPLPGRR